MRQVKRKRHVLRTVAASILLSITGIAGAQSPYPSKPIRVIVAFSAGGVSDILARSIGQELSRQLGQPVIVDNKVGAGGMIGTKECIKAAPDGYTLCLGSSSSVILGPMVLKAADFDARKDLQPISALATFPGVMAMNPAFGVKTPSQFLAWAKTNPGAGYGTSGIGTLFYVMGLVLNRSHGTTLEPINYKGGAAAVVDAVAGTLPVVIDTIPSILPHIQRGALVPIVTTGSTRAAELPDVPTMTETLLPGFQFDSWQGLFAPAGLPPEVLAKLSNAVVNVGAAPGMRERLAAMGGAAVFDTPEHFRASVHRDIPAMHALVRSVGIKPE